MKITKKMIELFLCFLLVAILLSACDYPETPPSAAHNTVESAEDSRAASEKIVWPPLPKDGKVVAMAENMLTVNYLVILDDSGSMDNSDCSGEKFSSKMDAAKSALVDFSKAIPVDDNIGLVTFDRDSLRVPLGVNNRSAFVNAVRSEKPEHSTPLDSAIRVAYSVITTQAQKQSGYGEYHVVIVTDGAADVGEDPTETVNWIVDNTPIMIHTVGFCIDMGHSLNQPGRTNYRTADNPKDLNRGLKDVLAEAPTFDVSEFK